MFRARLGKHIAGHPLSYGEAFTTTRSPRAQTFPLNPIETDNTTRLGHTNSAPPSTPTWREAPEIREPSLSAGGETNTAPSIDPETGSEVPMNRKKHWWRKEKKEPREHSAATRAAHAKPARQIMKEILFSSWANVLLVFIPVGIALHFTNVNPTVIFIMNFLAIVPLAGLLSFATEEIAIKVGQTLGGLMNATFGNAVELIVSIIALIQGKVVIVQASLLGSILSNLLLVLGMCFFFGGLKHKEQEFNTTVAQTASSLLALAISSLLIPAAFDSALNITDISNDSTLAISRGTSVILIVVYGMYLYFQLGSHTYLYDEIAAEEADAAMEIATIPPWWAVGLLFASTALVAVNAEFLVDSIDGMVEGSGISETFVGLILLPIVGNAAEHVTAVTVAIKNKMDLAIGVAVGSSMQIALLVTPFTVLLGWILGTDMTLFFNTFETAILFITVFIVNYLIQDGKSNYLEGGLLMAVYVIISVAVWFYPTL